MHAVGSKDAVSRVVGYVELEMAGLFDALVEACELKDRVAVDEKLTDPLKVEANEEVKVATPDCGGEAEGLKVREWVPKELLLAMRLILPVKDRSEDREKEREGELVRSGVIDPLAEEVVEGEVDKVRDAEGGGVREG